MCLARQVQVQNVKRHGPLQVEFWLLCIHTDKASLHTSY